MKVYKLPTGAHARQILTSSRLMCCDLRKSRTAFLGCGGTSGGPAESERGRQHREYWEPAMKPAAAWSN